MTNIVRGIIFLLGPLAGYLGWRSPQGIFIGTSISASVVGLLILADYVQLDSIIFGALGGVGGLMIAGFALSMLKRSGRPSFSDFANEYSALFYIFLGLFGCLLAIQKKGELDLLDRDIIIRGKKNKDVKIVDTSVLIDGRLADISETGFLPGKLLIPRFILHELQMVADSSDATKRQRGRRGLDILKRLQDNEDIAIKIYDKDYPHIKEVDSKLLELAKDLGAKVLTNDFNLSKVAAVQGISILNVNDLAEAMKAVVLPGDVISIYLAKEGKEKAQAVGYLDDGTMVVVDDARKLVGKRLPVLVNSILQTSAGRMIFARMNQEGHSRSDDLKSASA